VSTVKLLSENYEQLSSQGIPIDQLPRTIQHASDLAFRLGYKRIWIDALCIIQDDSDDWRQEAARMADVYANSVLTIAAWGSSSCDQGLFTVRDPLLVAPCKLSVALRQHTHWPVHVYCKRVF
jgi:Heterokaryon incompatibility protein (HET)